MVRRRRTDSVRRGAMIVSCCLFATAPTAALAQGCFLTSEQTFGMTKTCFYNCFGIEKRVTISSLRLCPLTTGDSGAEQQPQQAQPGAAQPEYQPPSGEMKPWTAPPASLGQPLPTQPAVPGSATTRPLTGQPLPAQPTAPRP
jgi:hypothetical protein